MEIISKGPKAVKSFFLIFLPLFGLATANARIGM